MSAWRTCPNCGTNWCSGYANGTWEELYCQHCSYEARVPTTNNDMKKVEIGPSAWSSDSKNRKQGSGNKKYDWTKE